MYKVHNKNIEEVVCLSLLERRIENHKAIVQIARTPPGICYSHGIY